MQELKLSDELMLMVHDGTKRGTARKGRRDIALAHLKLEAVNGTVESVVVDVNRVTFTRLRDVPQSVIENEGYMDDEEFIRSLKRFYPDCTLSDEFTLIEW